MRIIITVTMLAICLVGCQTTKLVPVYTMPDAPVALTTPLPPLQQIAPGKVNGTE